MEATERMLYPHAFHCVLKAYDITMVTRVTLRGWNLKFPSWLQESPSQYPVQLSNIPCNSPPYCLATHTASFYRECLKRSVRQRATESNMKPDHISAIQNGIKTQIFGREPCSSFWACMSKGSRSMIPPLSVSCDSLLEETVRAR